MTSAVDMAIPRAPRPGKRILRLLLWTLAGIVVFFVLLFLASRSASEAVREIEADRATGLASTISLARMLAHETVEPVLRDACCSEFRIQPV